jgi:uncharacterized protein
MREYKILAISGGGIRGILPATYLAELETENGRTSQYFHMLAGTSTGAIIALAVALNIPASEVQRLYTASAKDVFSRNYKNGPKSLFSSKYKNTKLKTELQKVFGSHLLRECVTDICIPAVDIASGMAIVFNKKDFPDALAWEVALSSAAAPVYFPPATFDGNSQLKGTYIDGGLWANNPSLVAISESLSQDQGSLALDKIRILSLGTGYYPQRMPLGRIFSGLISWGSFLFDATLFAQSSAIERSTSRILGRRYIHIDIPLLAEESSLDALGAIQRLSHLEKNLYGTHEQAKEIRHHFLSEKVQR